MNEVSIDEQVETLMFGTEFGDAELGAAMRRELRGRLTLAAKEGRPLRVYAGYDPSAPDIHIGHAISMRRLRMFQDYGHHVIFLIGTFTAQVGDTSDKTSGRPRKTYEDVLSAAQTYAEQAFRILDRDRTEVVYNADWLQPIDLGRVIELASHFTVQQFLVRDNYRKRLESGSPVGLHEFMYALLQGYDAVHLRADAQLGATDQLFNIKAGRKLQEAYGQLPCVCVCFPILVGTDGTARMSKSTGNYIGIAEPPEQQFGKAMSISDDTMLEWIRYVTRWKPAEIEGYTAQVKAQQLHPMELKKRMAWEIVATYHGDQAADDARAAFEKVFQKGSLPDEMPERVLDGPIAAVELLVAAGFAASKSEARRLIDGKGVTLDDLTVTAYDQPIRAPGVLKAGKRRFLRLITG